MVKCIYIYTPSSWRVVYLIRSALVNKSERKSKGQSRMDNPEKLATLGKQDTGRRKKKRNKKTQKTKKMSNTAPLKPGCLNLFI